MRSAIIHIAALSFSTTIAFAQTFINNTSVFIAGDVSVYVNDITNEGFIRNNGSIDVAGDWNNQQMYSGDGAVVLSGTNQEIDNNNQSIDKLLVNGNGTKKLEGRLVITSSVEFASGIVEVGEHDTLYVEKGATIEGGSSSSFVDGALTVGGNGYKFFPVGRNGLYYPVAFTEVEGNPVIQVTAFANMPDVATATEVEIDRRVYWTTQTISGGFNGSTISAPVHFEIDETERVVFVVAKGLDDEFAIVENDDIQTSEGRTFALSKEKIKRSVFAIGELPKKPLMASYLSTTLSPNASNEVNRAVKMFGPDLTGDNFHFQVVNRFGATMFETRSLEDMATTGWDGKHNGHLLPAGAYPYRLSYRDRRGKESTTRGFITIVY